LSDHHMRNYVTGLYFYILFFFVSFGGKLHIKENNKWDLVIFIIYWCTVKSQNFRLLSTVENLA
jgi:hypothetical protein